MPNFRTSAFATPVGKNVYLRSTRDVKRFSWTFAEATLPAVTIDTFTGQKVLQPGVVLAKITSGPDTGKVGPFQGTGTAEVQTLTQTGSPTGGTFTITTLGVTTAAIAFNATAAVIATAVNLALSNADIDAYVVGGGGPLNTTPVTLTFLGAAGQGDVAQVTVAGSLTGGTTPAVTPTTTTPGVTGAADGRQTLANIVGFNDTFLPWQLMNRDVEIAYVVEAAVVQSNCFEMTSAGLFIPLTNTTAAEMVAKKSLDIKFF